MFTIKVMSGDIADVPADALITAINSEGIWFGRVDKAIYAANASLFHEQALQALPLQHGETVVASGNNAHQSAFKNVVFVIDDLRGPLGNIVYNGLRAAAEAEYASVSLPVMRTGVMAGKVERTVGETLDQIADGIRRFRGNHRDTSLTIVKIVVYNDPMTEQKLKVLLTEH